VPLLAQKTFRKWIETNKSKTGTTSFVNGKVVLFVMSLQIIMMFQGIDAFELLTKLGYEVIFVDHEESGRAYISKGFLEEAKAIANTNVAILTPIISEVALIGIEPSAILTFRDEYIRWLMIPLPLKSWQNCLTIEEFSKGNCW
jgi:Fe-S oxidoreductase